ncbi:MAG: DUF4280 domain-containing protein [Anaerolineae bacterium]|nr:DUF4280 domain-containing protein [Anaerolineae bacterium]
MGILVVNGAMTSCTFGLAPSTLMVLPTNKVLAANMPAATIMDNKPLVNILPFGMCNSMANPTVASATAAASGVLTPMPCVPVVPAPWAPGSPTVLIANLPALNNSSKAACTYGGVISITMPGQALVQVP